MQPAEQGKPKNVFARVGMSHLTRRIGEPYAHRVADSKGVNINTSSQPNSNPHFGTITTLMCVAAIAEELETHFQKPTQITFDMLENAPDRKVQGIQIRKVDGNDVEYYISLADSTTDEGQLLIEKNMETFYRLFSFFEHETGIPFVVRSYRECQNDPSFRRALLTMFNNQGVFEPIIAPGTEKMRLRFPCPTCKWIDKASTNTRVVSRSPEEIVFEAYCPDHGPHRAILAENRGDYFDTNTPLRDVAKVAGLIEAGKMDGHMPLMVDGRDWSGRWDRAVHVPGVALLGYPAWELPARIYPPTVTDMLGAKLSKSLYVGNLYEHIPKGFADFADFMEVYSESGLQKLWNHVREWGRDPAYMDRDSYTILYFSLLMEDKLEPASIKG